MIMTLQLVVIRSSKLFCVKGDWKLINEIYNLYKENLPDIVRSEVELEYK